MGIETRSRLIVYALVLWVLLPYSLELAQLTQGQLITPTFEMNCRTGGDLFLRDTRLSIEILNSTSIRTSAEIDFQSKGSGPIITWRIRYLPVYMTEASFKASNASIQILGYIMTWESPSSIAYTVPPVVQLSVPYRSFGVAGTWDRNGQEYATVTYLINLTNPVNEGQQSYVNTQALPIEAEDLIVVGRIALSIDVQGGVCGQADSFFLDTSYEGRVNGTIASLELVIPAEAHITFNSDNLVRMRPNVLFGSFPLIPEQEFLHRFYIQYEILPWHRRYPWSEMIFPGFWTVFGLILGEFIRKIKKLWSRKKPPAKYNIKRKAARSHKNPLNRNILGKF